MAENIRDYLSSMTVPVLGEPQFATQFNTFCTAIKDNINRIVSAPFLKGDRGSAIKLRPEPLYDVETNSWTEFAQELFRAIYTYKDGSEQEDYPLPLLHFEDDPDHPDRLLKSDDDVSYWNEMIEIDGGYIGGHYSYGSIFQVYEDGKSKLNELIYVGYDEATGEKFFWTPFWFFDARLAYLKDMENISDFRDMSCTVWGSWKPIPGEDETNPDNWEWNFEVKKLVPTIYWEDSVDQFCWSIFGERTGIIAQGIQGEPGAAGRIWLCQGSIDGDRITINGVLEPDIPGLQITDLNTGDLALVIYDTTDSGGEFSDMRFGSVHTSGSSRYILMQQTNLPIIETTRNYSLRDYLDSIGTTSNVFAGADDDEHGIPGWSRMLYTRETPSTDSDTPVMGMWAESDGNHYISPETYESTTRSDASGANPVSDKTLKIMYDNVYMGSSRGYMSIINESFNTISAFTSILNIESLTGTIIKTGLFKITNHSNMDDFRTDSHGVHLDYLSPINEDCITITGEELSSSDTYQLYSVCNIYGIRPRPFPENPFGESDRYPEDNFQNEKMYLNCELILGFGNNLNNYSEEHKTSFPTDIYRAHKYEIKLTIPSSHTPIENSSIIIYDPISKSSYTDQSLIPFPFNPNYKFKVYFKPSGTGDNDKIHYIRSQAAGSPVEYYLDGGWPVIELYNSSNQSTDWYTDIIFTHATNIWCWLMDKKYSFISPFQKDNLGSSEYLDTSNSILTYSMDDGKVIKLQDEDINWINKTYYETINYDEYNIGHIKFPGQTITGTNIRIEKNLHIYPDGINGMTW